MLSLLVKAQCLVVRPPHAPAARAARLWRSSPSKAAHRPSRVATRGTSPLRARSLRNEPADAGDANGAAALQETRAGAVDAAEGIDRERAGVRQRREAAGPRARTSGWLAVANTGESRAASAPAEAAERNAAGEWAAAVTSQSRCQRTAPARLMARSGRWTP